MLRINLKNLSDKNKDSSPLHQDIGCVNSYESFYVPDYNICVNLWQYLTLLGYLVLYVIN